MENCTLVAIARNEERFLLEWISYHLSIGFSKIIIFDNNSDDNSWHVLKRLRSADDRIEALRWFDVPDQSAQLTAYNFSRSLVNTPWIAFLDIDEFFVLKSYECLQDLLERVPDNASSLHVNWRGFGSSNIEYGNYELVTDAFRSCAPRDWSNHYHFKSLARTELFERATVHNIVTSKGVAVLSDFSEFLPKNGAFSDRVVYGHCQINHYQSKTYPEFIVRMSKGNASEPPNSSHRQRSFSLERFKELDRNEETDLSIQKHAKRSYALLQKMKNIISVL